MPKNTFAGHGLFIAMKGDVKRLRHSSLANDPLLSCRHPQSELRVITYQSDDGEPVRVQRCQVCFDQAVRVPADMTVEISRELPWFLQGRAAAENN